MIKNRSLGSSFENYSDKTAERDDLVMIGPAADSVADAAEGVVNALGDFAADIVETLGNLVQDSLKVTGDAACALPRIGSFVRGALGWLGEAVAGSTNLAGAVIKGALGIAASVIAGMVRLVVGLLMLSRRLMAKGLIDIGSSISGAVILISGQLISLIQRLFFLQESERPLTRRERNMLRRIFHSSLALYNIRIIEGRSGIFGMSHRAFALGNTIYLKGVNPAAAPGVLVHECVHVWQYQNLGSRYAMDALGAQAYYGLGRGGAYDWQAEFARGRSRWRDFNREAQAAFMQHVWDAGTLTALGQAYGPGNGVFYDLEEVLGVFGPGSAIAQFIVSYGTDLTCFASESIAQMRSRINIRWSHGFVRFSRT
jgi:hypothetical protein